MRIRFLSHKKAQGRSLIALPAWSYSFSMPTQTQAPPSPGPTQNKSCCSFKAVDPIYA